MTLARMILVVMAVFVVAFAIRGLLAGRRR